VKAVVPLDQARAQAWPWVESPSGTPSYAKLGEIQIVSPIPLKELVELIDWTPFFSVWQMRGAYPRVLERPEAQELFEEAKTLLNRLVDQNILQARAVFGVFSAHSKGDDIHLGSHVFPMLRQQAQRSKGKPNYCLADFLSPEPGSDSMGLFAVSAGFGCDEEAKRYEAEHDDYHAIMLRALADRLAEAAAEWVHREVRVGWGLEERDQYPLADLLKDKYSGIRPAPGYPACPDHHTKQSMWEILGVEERVGIKLMESGSMWPASSVSGMILHHPESRYFSIGRIGKDQLEDYAQRLGQDSEAVARRMPNLL